MKPTIERRLRLLTPMALGLLAAACSAGEPLGESEPEVGEARGAACSNASLPPSANQMQASLVALYRFDACSGATATESTGLGTDGALYNFPTDDSQWVPGKIGGALDFRGPSDGDHVIAPDYVKPTGSMTVTAWVWARSAPWWASILKNWGSSQVGQFHFGLDDFNGNLSNYFDSFSSFTSEPGLFPIGSWEHVAFVADAAQNTMSIYRNGVLAGGPTFYDGVLDPAPMQSLGIGVKTDNSGTTADPFIPGYWHGMMDDMALWTRALSPAEIAIVHAAGQGGVSVGEIPDPTCVFVAAVEDAHIADDKPTKNWGSSGSVSTGAVSPGLRQGLMRFDLSAIPAGAIVTSATATLTVMLNGGLPVQAHVVTAPWSQATVTYASFGGSYDPAVTATFPGTAAPGAASADLTAAVQSWVSGAAPNYGVLLEQGASGLTTFGSSEVTPATARPKLQVCYFN